MSQAKTVSNSLTPSWQLVPKSLELFRHYFQQVVVIAALPVLLIDLGSLLMSHAMWPLGVLVLLAGYIWLLVSIGAHVYLQINAARQKEVTVATCYQEGLSYLLRLIGFGLLFGALLVVGFILLIVPFFMILRRYILTPYYIVDQNLSITQAMKRSDEQTDAVAGSIWGVIGVYVVLSIVVGIISLPFSVLPGLPTVIMTLLGLTYNFIAVLRYKEVVANASA